MNKEELLGYIKNNYREEHDVIGAGLINYHYIKSNVEHIEGDVVMAENIMDGIVKLIHLLSHNICEKFPEEDNRKIKKFLIEIYLEE
jgi:hypothetical protein